MIVGGGGGASKGNVTFASSTGDDHGRGRMIEMGSRRVSYSSEHEDASKATPAPASSCMLMPESPCRIAWDSIMMVAVVYSFTVIPFQFAFLPSSSVSLDNVVADGLFLLDIVVQFFSAQTTSSGEVLVHRRASVLYYVKGWFAVDLVSSVPYSFIALSSDMHPNIDGVFIPVNVLRLTRLFKALKAIRMRGNFTNAEFSTRMHPGVARFLRLSFTVFIVGHISACLWYFIGKAYDHSPDSWIQRVWTNGAAIKDHNAFERYVISMYFAFTTLTTVGFGDLTPKTRPEMVFAMLLFVIGVLLFSYTMANVTSLFYEYDRETRKYRDRMSALILFCRSAHLTPPVERQVVHQMSREWRHVPMSHDWETVRLELPSELRFLIMWDCHAATLKVARPFALLQANDLDDVHRKLIASIQPFHAVRGQIIGRAGEPCKGLYIVARGTVEQTAKANGQQVALYNHGNCFGEVGLLLSRAALWPSTFTCKTASQLLYISADDFFDAVSESDAAREMFVQRAHSKLARLRALGSATDIRATPADERSRPAAAAAAGSVPNGLRPANLAEIETALSRLAADLVQARRVQSLLTNFTSTPAQTS
ncbi:hypothetical protein PBRA_000620 [Plasmodiophora brassicae]|uniref:Cyclic nucleotide-binding domain-containing protein n=1 Tax=Plasmodiophora brassicae TaxID=37360 RepID=A0A0G4IPZ3_PLABS|nr:hypothetical protein PBRA_000620 [Plasmodiophora brassicae]